MWSRGFSLVEMVVAIGFIAILLAIGYPHLARLAAIYRLEGSARNLALTFQKVRLRAIAEGKCFQVTFDGAARTYRVLSKAGTTPCGISGFTNDGVAQKLDDADTISVAATASPVFDARGGAPTPSVVTLANRDGGVQLVGVNGAGRVHVQ
ncbi:MAG: GspH/FimT family pseudopilin [Candidatus Binatia bacterium]